MNGNALTFAKEVEGETWEYQVLELDTLNKAQLWYRAPWSDRFEVGHSKGIPSGTNFKWTAEVMRRFQLGVISADDYAELLPC